MARVTASGGAAQASRSALAEQQQEEVVRVLVPHYEDRIRRACGQDARRIPIDIHWESFLRSKRSDAAISALHIWNSFFVLHRIADVIEELCREVTNDAPASSTSSSSSSSSSASTAFALYPDGRSILASKLVRIVIQNEDKKLRGRDKVVLKPYYLKRKGSGDVNAVLQQQQQQPPSNREEEEEERVWVLNLRGNFSSGPLGGFSRKRLLAALARRLRINSLHHRALLDHVLLPRYNTKLARVLQDHADDHRDDPDVKEISYIDIAIDWETIHGEDEDELALRNIAAWGAHYSLAQIVHAFRHLNARRKWRDWSVVVERVIVRYVPGLDIARKRCFVENKHLFVDGVWEVDGWHGGFHHKQIAEVLEQAYKLSRADTLVGSKKLACLERVINSSNALNGHIGYLKWALSHSCFKQPDEALEKDIHTHLQPFLTKDEEIIHSWYCTKINFRGQAQERIVVLTDCAVLTFAYDFKCHKIDESRVHRHMHEHFKHITYGQYMNSVGGQTDYCVRYETHEPIKKEKDTKSARALSNLTHAESLVELNQKILSLVELMVEKQLQTDDAGSTSSASEELLQQELDTGIKGPTGRRLIKLISETVLKYLDNYPAEGLPQLPSGARIMDILALLASILEDHQHALLEGLAQISDSESPHLRSQVKLDSVKTTLQYVLQLLTAQIKALMGKGMRDEEKIRPSDFSSSFSTLNFTLSPPTTASSVHIIFFVSQLLKQLQRLERIEQVEIINRRNDELRKTKTRREQEGNTSRETTVEDQSRSNSVVNDEGNLSGSTSTTIKTTRKRTLAGPAANNRRLFHLPVPQPMAISRLLERIMDHLSGLSIPAFRFPPSLAVGSCAIDFAAQFTVSELVDVVARATFDKPIPAIEIPGYRPKKMISVLERCVEPLLLLDLPPFKHPMVDQILQNRSRDSTPSTTGASPSLFRRFIPQEPVNWVLLLLPSADEDPDIKRELVEEISWAIYGVARTALRPWWVPRPQQQDMTGPSSFFAQVYNKTGQGRSNRQASTSIPSSPDGSIASPSTSPVSDSPRSAPTTVTRDSSSTSPASKRASVPWRLSSSVLAAALDRKRALPTPTHNQRASEDGESEAGQINHADPDQ